MIYTTNILEQKLVAEGTREVILKLPHGFEYKAGQHIQISVPELKHTDPKGNSRVFSLTSSPNNTRSLSVLFRDTGSGYKKTLSSLSVGVEVMIEGPMGHFVFQKEPTIPHVYIAGGVGITPFLSMIKYNEECTNHTLVTLLYANRNENTAAYLSELQKLALQSHWFTLNEVYGKIIDASLLKSKEANEDALWWIVGPPPMVSEVEHLLKQVDVRNDMIRTEPFTGY